MNASHVTSSVQHFDVEADSITLGSAALTTFSCDPQVAVVMPETPARRANPGVRTALLVEAEGRGMTAESIDMLIRARAMRREVFSVTNNGDIRGSGDLEVRSNATIGGRLRVKRGLSVKDDVSLGAGLHVAGALHVRIILF